MEESDATAERLRDGVESVLDGDDWSLGGDPAERLRIEFSDRTVVVDSHDGPGGEPRWSLTLRAGGATVGKFGRFEAVEDVCARLATLQRTDVRYTVCCDGERS